MKPNHYTQLYLHIVFAVKFRESLLNNNQQKELWKYISGIITNLRHKSIIVNGYRDHVHILLGWNPVMSVSDIVRDIKRSSAIFVNQKKWFMGSFQWQEGYGGFSLGRSDIPVLFQYIMNQQEQHKTRSFREEYISLLRDNEIDFDQKYLFEFFD